MVKSKPEKRATPRVSWQLPASVKFPSDEKRSQVETRDISSHGMFFFAETRLQVGSRIEVVVMMPPEVERFARRWVCCQATLTRVEEDPAGQRFGIAAVIDRCEALPEI